MSGMTSITHNTSPSRAAVVLASVLAWLLACWGAAAARGDDPVPFSPSERMAAQGFIRYRSAWRTAQEIELIERDEAAKVAAKQWTGQLERLRRSLDKPSATGRAADEIRGISDPLALAALAAAVQTEPVFQVRTWYLEAMSRIRTPDAAMALVAVALDHPDPETRITATERLVLIGPHQAVPVFVSALGSADNAQVNRAAECLASWVCRRRSVRSSPRSRRTTSWSRRGSSRLDERHLHAGRWRPGDGGRPQAEACARAERSGARGARDAHRRQLRVERCRLAGLARQRAGAAGRF